MQGLRDEDARKRILLALADADTVSAAAEAAGVNRKLVYRWAERCQDVRSALTRLQGERGDSPQTKRRERDRFMQAHEPEDPDLDLGLDTLRQVAADPEAPPASRVSAARALIRAGENRLMRQAAPTTPPAANDVETPDAPIVDIEDARRKVMGE